MQIKPVRGINGKNLFIDIKWCIKIFFINYNIIIKDSV